MNPSERFWSRVSGDSFEECWNWTSTTSHNGYGRISIGGKKVRAHRYAYESMIAKIPAGLALDHLCRNRLCVNPWHLEPVSTRVNNARAAEVVKQCPQGHPYDEANTYVYEATTRAGNLTTYRMCKACTIARTNIRDAARKAARTSRKSVA